MKPSRLSPVRILHVKSRNMRMAGPTPRRRVPLLTKSPLREGQLGSARIRLSQKNKVNAFYANALLAPALIRPLLGQASTSVASHSTEIGSSGREVPCRMESGAATAVGGRYLHWPWSGHTFRGHVAFHSGRPCIELVMPRSCYR